MRIEHIAIWVKDLELMKDFYVKYFNCVSNDKYINTKKNFQSYFIQFDSGCRLELMTRPDIPDNMNNILAEYIGIIHFAISTGSKDEVDRLTELLRDEAYNVLGEPRTTGDGYYESVVLDPEANRIEITV